MADSPRPDVEIVHTDDVLSCNIRGHGATAHRFATPVVCLACPGQVCAPQRREVPRG